MPMDVAAMKECFLAVPCFEEEFSEGLRLPTPARSAAKKYAFHRMHSNLEDPPEALPLDLLDESTDESSEEWPGEPSNDCSEGSEVCWPSSVMAACAALALGETGAWVVAASSKVWRLLAPRLSLNGALSFLMRSVHEPALQPEEECKTFKACDFHHGRVLGAGAFGEVVAVTHVPSGRQYALKMHAKAALAENGQTEQVARERSVHETLSHPFIVGMLGGYEDQSSTCLVLELVQGGDMLSYIKDKGPLGSDLARFCAAQVISALEYCHDSGVVHRDVKPENVVLDADMYVKLIDFGWAKMIGKDGSTRTLCGTPEYTAPEMILLQEHGALVDWWSLGVLIYEMLAGHAPFRGTTMRGIYEQVLNVQADYAAIPQHHALPIRQAVALLKQCLAKDPRQRVGSSGNGAASIKQANWFAGLDWHGLLQKELSPPVSATW